MAPNELRPWLQRRARADPATIAAVSAVLAALHERVLQGDRAACEDFTGQMLPALRNRLRAAFPRADWDDLNDAVEDAILQYLARPQRFDPTRGVPLDRFLYLVAWRRLANRLRNAAARARMDRTYLDSVPPDGHVDEATADHDGERGNLIHQLFAAASDPLEHQALRCWLSGEPVSKLASALGFADRPLGEQQGEVKRFKDRIRARLRRQLTADNPRNGPRPTSTVVRRETVDQLAS